MKPKETDLIKLMMAKDFLVVQAHYEQAAEVLAAREEIEYLRGVVGKLPKTADGVPIVSGDKVWVWWESDKEGTLSRWFQITVLDTYHVNRGWVVSDNGSEFEPSDCYSTREAAEKARGGK